MAKEGIFRMSAKEVKRAGAIQRVIERSITQIKAGDLLGLCARQIRRIAKRYKAEGEKGLIHKLRGMISGRRRKDKDKILGIYKKRYPDFGPLLASEKLLEREKISISHETLRRWLLEDSKEREWTRKKRAHRKWRERREYFGEMVQMDGSHHNWLERRGPKLVLMGYVDDATGEKFGRFYLYEGTVPAMGSFAKYADKYGIPLSVYLDRHSTYKTTRHQTIFEELNDKEALTQFERAMEELGVKVIHAHSAPAKGRVENMFKTFQDRLVKEMRLVGIKTLEAANEFLEIFLAKYNKRFRVLAKKPEDLHMKKLARHILEKILCIRTRRALHKDSTIRHNKKVYLITERISNRTDHVQMEERIDGSIWIKHKDRYLKYKEIDPSVKVSEDKLKLGEKTIKWRKYNENSRPKKYHTWRTRKKSDYHIDITDFDETRDEAITADLAKMA